MKDDILNRIDEIFTGKSINEIAQYLEKMFKHHLDSLSQLKSHNAGSVVNTVVDDAYTDLTRIKKQLSRMNTARWT